MKKGVFVTLGNRRPMRLQTIGYPNLAGGGRALQLKSALTSAATISGINPTTTQLKDNPAICPMFQAKLVLAGECSYRFCDISNRAGLC